MPPEGERECAHLAEPGGRKADARPQPKRRRKANQSEMKKSILCLVIVAGVVLGGCAAREIETETDVPAVGAQGSGVTDASAVNGAPAAGAASSAASGHPGR